jgi:hypothetical protein
MKKAMRNKKTLSSKTTSVVGHKKMAGGGEAWRVRTSDGRVVTLKSSASATASMDRAAKRFAGALKRLADR